MASYDISWIDYKMICPSLRHALGCVRYPLLSDINQSSWYSLLWSWLTYGYLRWALWLDPGAISLSIWMPTFSYTLQESRETAMSTCSQKLPRHGDTISSLIMVSTQYQPQLLFRIVGFLPAFYYIKIHIDSKSVRNISLHRLTAA
jgi:hypothetical protein